MTTFRIWLAATLAAVFIFGIPSVFAEIEHGKNYDRELLSVDGNTGTFLWTSKPERIIDYYQDTIPVFSNYRLFETSNIIQLETNNSGSYVFDKNTCSYNLYHNGYVGGANTPKVKGISWTVKGKPAASGTWTNVASINDATCQTSVTSTDESVILTGTKSNPVGTFQIELKFVAGQGIKETLRAYNNNPVWTNHNVGFTETMLVPQIIKLGNNEYDLSLYNQTVLGRTWIENNGAKLVRLTDNVFYDFGIGFDHLNDIKIIWNGTQAKLALNYLYPTQTVPYQTWFEVDPTFGYTTGTNYGVFSGSGAGATCIETSYTLVANDILYLRASGSAGADTCYRQSYRWDLSSLPSQIRVTNSTVRVTTTLASGGPGNCDFRNMQFDPATQASSSLWGDIGNGTAYILNNAVCAATNTNQVIDLGATSDTDIQAARNSGKTWTALGIKLTSEARPAATAETDFTGNRVELQITYFTDKPHAPSGLSAESQARKAQFTWSNTNGTTVTGYWIGRSLDNSTWPQANKTLTGNVTSYLHTGYWAVNKLYYVNVTATNGLNSTGSSFSSFTTDNRPSAPLTPYTTPMSATVIKLNWLPPSSNGGDPVTQYRIEACLVCSSWSVLSNTTTTLNYNHTGLSLGQLWKYRLAAWNGVDLSAYTANFTGKTYESTSGAITLVGGNVGDVENINATITLSNGSPPPFTVLNTYLYRNNTLVSTNATDFAIPALDAPMYSRIWYQMVTDNANVFHVKMQVSNITGTVTVSSSNNVTVTREYDPDYFTAEDETLGTVNYTTSRSDDGVTAYLKVNRNKGGDIFPVSCLYQDLFQALANDGEGTWFNVTDSGWYNATVSVSPIPTIYITCLNPPNILFTTTLYSEENPLAAGIALFDAFGGIMGAPSIILIILAIFSLATGKNSPQILVLAMIVIGVLTSIGLIVFENNIFPMLLVAAAVGIFAMRRYYF